jgi:hypothetical protein
MNIDLYKGLTETEIVSRAAVLTKSGVYDLITGLARQRQQPGQSDAQAFTKFVTTDDLGRELYFMHKNHGLGRNSDVPPPKPAPVTVRKADDPELNWNGLVYGLHKLMGWSITKAGDEARKLPGGQQLWKAFHQPPVVGSIAEPQAPSRVVGDAGYAPGQWKSPHSGSPPDRGEREIDDYEFWDPAMALQRFNELVDEIMWRQNLSMSKAQDYARLRHPAQEALGKVAQATYWRGGVQEASG